MASSTRRKAQDYRRWIPTAISWKMRLDQSRRERRALTSEHLCCLNVGFVGRLPPEPATKRALGQGPGPYLPDWLVGFPESSRVLHHTYTRH